MSNTKKKMVLVGGILMLLSYLTPSIAAIYPAVQPYAKPYLLGEILKLNYYRLDISNCKNVPDWLRENMSSSAMLSNEEFEQMKTVLQKSITRYNRKTRGNLDFQINGLYGVQCIPYVDKNGRKQIWINGFCGDSAPNQNPVVEVIFAFDGGPCFFGTTIRAGSNKLVNVGIHGFT